MCKVTADEFGKSNDGFVIREPQNLFTEFLFMIKKDYSEPILSEKGPTTRYH